MSSAKLELALIRSTYFCNSTSLQLKSVDQKYLQIVHRSRERTSYTD
jgi:hypothetical protein